MFKEKHQSYNRTFHDTDPYLIHIKELLDIRLKLAEYSQALRLWWDPRNEEYDTQRLCEAAVFIET